MPKSRFCFGLLVLFSLCLTAQEGPVGRLKGKVVLDTAGVTDVHIFNISRVKATISDQAGNFSIEAAQGDTLSFSAVHLKRTSLVVSAEMLDSPLILVPLEEFVNELDEVVVRPYNLSGDIARDLNQMPGEKVLVASTLGLPNAYVVPPTQSERKLYEATSGRGIVPLNPVLNGISGRTRYLKEMVARENKYARTERVREFYADSLFINEIGIPRDHIDHFMYYCEVDPDFAGIVDSADKLRIWEYFKVKALAYRENYGL